MARAAALRCAVQPPPSRVDRRLLHAEAALLPAPPQRWDQRQLIFPCTFGELLNILSSLASGYLAEFLRSSCLNAFHVNGWGRCYVVELVWPFKTGLPVLHLVS